MKIIPKIRVIVVAALLGAMLAAPEVRGQSAEEFQQLKAMIEQMQKTIEAQNARIAELDKKQPAPSESRPGSVPGQTVATSNPNALVTQTNQFLTSSPSFQVMQKILAGEPVAKKSPITFRDALNDQQEAATRPKDYTLDPEFRGFIPIPNTPALIKFNAKPHLDITMDNKEAGNHNRFVPAV